MWQHPSNWDMAGGFPIHRGDDRPGNMSPNDFSDTTLRKLHALQLIHEHVNPEALHVLSGSGDQLQALQHQLLCQQWEPQLQQELEQAMQAIVTVRKGFNMQGACSTHTSTACSSSLQQHCFPSHQKHTMKACYTQTRQTAAHCRAWVLTALQEYHHRHRLLVELWNMLVTLGIWLKSYITSSLVLRWHTRWLLGMEVRCAGVTTTQPMLSTGALCLMPSSKLELVHGALQSSRGLAQPLI